MRHGCMLVPVGSRVRTQQGPLGPKHTRRQPAPASFVLKSPETRRTIGLDVTAVPPPSAIIEFGRFTVVRHRRELLVDGQLVQLGGRAFDALLALIDSRGNVIFKDDLLRRVWPDRVVEEHNLHAQISALRKAFGPDRGLIRTVAGRGYQFTGEVRATEAEAAPAAPPRVTNLPEAVSEL